MCLTARRETCPACYGIATSWRLMDQLEDDMADGRFKEQEYIKWMAEFKGLFERSNEGHKQKGCCDHPTEENDESDDESDDDDEDDVVAVQPFFWRGTDYFIEDLEALEDTRYSRRFRDLRGGERYIFSADGSSNIVGHVSGEGAVTFYTTDDD